MKKETVIIIGGGSAGLMAARELADEFNVIVLEALSRLGGRIWTHRLQDGSLVEAGAEFIHGHPELTIRLLEEAGIGYRAVAGKMFQKEKGSLEEIIAPIEGWEELVKQMKKVETDMTLQDFLNEYFGGDSHADLRRHARAYAEGFDLADPAKASVQSLYNEWSNEELENFRIPSGYGALVDFLRRECEDRACRILTNTIIKQVDWEKIK
jgi:monoamine oxidase